VVAGLGGSDTGLPHRVHKGSCFNLHVVRARRPETGEEVLRRTREHTFCSAGAFPALLAGASHVICRAHAAATLQVRGAHDVDGNAPCHCQNVSILSRPVRCHVLCPRHRPRFLLAACLRSSSPAHIGMAFCTPCASPAIGAGPAHIKYMPCASHANAREACGPSTLDTRRASFQQQERGGRV
jgi:hypothetical protein